MVFGGDFRQILPVVIHGSRSEVVSECLNRSPLWRNVRVLKLKINMRLQELSSLAALEEGEFSKFLVRFREGTDSKNNVIQFFKIFQA